jgi:hypothetical protein
VVVAEKEEVEEERMGLMVVVEGLDMVNGKWMVITMQRVPLTYRSQKLRVIESYKRSCVPEGTACGGWRGQLWG